MIEAGPPGAPVDRIVIAAPDWYGCEAAAARLARLAEAAGLAVDEVGPAQLDTMIWSAPGAFGLALHPGAEDALVAAATRRESPGAALDAWCAASDALLAQCRRLAPRIAVLDPHAVVDDDALAATLSRHLGLALAHDGAGPARSRDAAGGDPALRFLCRLAVLESADALAAADALRRFALPLWSAPQRERLDATIEALGAERPQAAAAEPDPASTALLEADLADARAALAEAEGKIALLQEQTVLLQEAVGADIFDTATLQHQTIYADDGLTHPAFYPPERRPADGRPFRWLGREAEAVLPTDISRTRAIRVDIELAVVLSRAAVDGLSVTLSGAAPVRTQTLALDDGSTLLRAEFAMPDDPDPLSLARIGLTAGHMIDLSSRGDPRSVAVGIHKIEIWHLEPEPNDAVLAEIQAESLAAAVPATAGNETAGNETADGDEAADGPAEAPGPRWLGPGSAPAGLTLALDRSRPLEVIVHVAEVRHQASLAALWVALDGVPGEDADTRPEGELGATKRLRFAAAPDHPGPTALTLGLAAQNHADEGHAEEGHADEGHAADEADPRHLAVAKIVVRALTA